MSGSDPELSARLRTDFLQYAGKPSRKHSHALARVRHVLARPEIPLGDSLESTRSLPAPDNTIRPFSIARQPCCCSACHCCVVALIGAFAHLPVRGVSALTA
jgi:hypothetical protein